MSLTASQLIVQLEDIDPEAKAFVLGPENYLSITAVNPCDRWTADGEPAFVLFRNTTQPEELFDEPPAPPAPEFNVGDKVVVTEEPDYLEGLVGTVGTIISPDHGAGFWDFRVDVEPHRYSEILVHTSNIRHATDEEIAADERRKALAKFKVGDRVRIVGDESGVSPHSIGLIGTITSTNDTFNEGFPIEIDVPGETIYWTCTPFEIELIPEPADVTVTIPAHVAEEYVSWRNGGIAQPGGVHWVIADAINEALAAQR